MPSSFGIARMQVKRWPPADCSVKRPFCGHVGTIEIASSIVAKIDRTAGEYVVVTPGRFVLVIQLDLGDDQRQQLVCLLRMSFCQDFSKISESFNRRSTSSRRALTARGSGLWADSVALSIRTRSDADISLIFIVPEIAQNDDPGLPPETRRRKTVSKRLKTKAQFFSLEKWRRIRSF